MASMTWPKRVIRDTRGFFCVTYATKGGQPGPWLVHLAAESFDEALEAARAYLRQHDDRFERILQIAVNPGVELMRIEEGLLS